jgi:outer membrane protein assembly factor BamB
LCLAALYFWFWIVTVATAFGPHPMISRSLLGESLSLLALIAVAASYQRGAGPEGRGALFPIIVATAWSSAGVALWYALCSPFSRAPWIAAFFVATTWWLLWAWLMFFVPWKFWTRLCVLVALISLVGAFRLGVRAEGIDGQALPRLVGRLTGEASAAEVASVVPSQKSSNADGSFPCFRGADGLGTVRNAHLAPQWPTGGPKLLWRHSVGAAWSAFAVTPERVFTQEQHGEEECVVCYARDTGEQLWRHADAAHYKAAGTGDGPRATPSVDGEVVYSLGATGILNALDCATGLRRWTVDILRDNDTAAPGHGLTGSPLVVDDLVVVAPGGKNGSLAAYEKSSGKRRWRAGTDPAGYASPMLAELAGQPQILIVSTQMLHAHDPRSGEILWSVPWQNDQQTNCSQPYPLDGNHVFISADYGTGCALLQIGKRGGHSSASKVWSSRAMQTKFCSAVVHSGHAYGLDDGILECISLADGRRRWKSGRYGHGQLLLADDLLIIQAEDGRVALVAAAPEGFRELAQFQAIEGKTWNYPALAGGQLFVRNDHEAACYLLPRKKAE